MYKHTHSLRPHTHVAQGLTPEHALGHNAYAVAENISLLHAVRSEHNRAILLDPLYVIDITSHTCLQLLVYEALS